MQSLKLPDIKIDIDNEKRIKELLNSSLIKEILNSFNININDISNLSLLEDYLDSEKECLKCKGLDNCPKKVCGQKMTLSYDGIIYDELKYCDYYLKMKEKDRFLNNMIYSDIPLKYKYLSLSSIKDEYNNLTKIDDRVKLYVLLNKMINEKTKKGLYICGNFGVGKTYLSIAFINELCLKGQKVAFIKVNDFINKMRKLVINDSEEYENVLNKIKNVSYLVLDDIGSETISAYSRDDLLFNILDYRMERDLFCQFTSNLTLDDLEKLFTYDKNSNPETLKAKRLMERIRYLSTPFNLTGENLRLK